VFGLNGGVNRLDSGGQGADFKQCSEGYNRNCQTISGLKALLGRSRLTFRAGACVYPVRIHANCRVFTWRCISKRRDRPGIFKDSSEFKVHLFRVLLWQVS